MSAELYGAEISGAMAQPAVDILPSAPEPKRKRDEVVEPAIAPVAEFVPPVEAALQQPAPVDSAPVATAPVVTPVPGAPTDAAAPRKVFGMAVRRSRKDASVPETVLAPSAPPIQAAPEVVAPPPAAIAAWPAPAQAPIPTGAPVQLDLLTQPKPVATPADDELRALRSLLEASEQARAYAESRATSAEARATHAEAYASQVSAQVTQAQAQSGQVDERLEAADLRARKAESEAEDWQIRHREAQQAIEELAASVASAEGRLAETSESLRSTTQERDELVAALDAVTASTPDPFS